MHSSMKEPCWHAGETGSAVGKLGPGWHEGTRAALTRIEVTAWLHKTNQEVFFLLFSVSAFEPHESIPYTYMYQFYDAVCISWLHRTSLWLSFWSLTCFSVLNQTIHEPGRMKCSTHLETKNLRQEFHWFNFKHCFLKHFNGSFSSKESWLELLDIFKGFRHFF